MIKDIQVIHALDVEASENNIQQISLNITCVFEREMLIISDGDIKQM